MRRSQRAGTDGIGGSAPLGVQLKLMLLEKEAETGRLQSLVASIKQKVSRRRAREASALCRRPRWAG
jgi:hypothetical protein